MKFDDSSLTDYLVKNLQPLTKADPVILSEYIAALLKKDKSTEELQKLCRESLVEFLGQNTGSFTEELFQALEDGSIVRVDGNLDDVEKPKSSLAVLAVETHQLKNSPKERIRPSSSEPTSDPEEKEVSEDDDRNHKHRRREARAQSLDNDVQEQPIRRANRKRSKPYDSGHVFLEPDPQTSGSQKGYNLTPENNTRQSVLGPPLRGPIGFDPQARLGQSFRSGLGPRFDLSASVGPPPISIGRGRNVASWRQHDLRFPNPLNTFDYAPQMASHGSGHPNLFIGGGFPNAASAQSATWSGFGFVHGMTNGILDPIHPIGFNGTLRPTITPPLNIGMPLPRQRCRDFEEKGFCLRGDMCPMEHGLNRIVVEDVQSLSQFNLPLSIPSSNTLGVQAGSGPSTTVSAPSSLLTNSKGAPSKTNKSEMMEAKPNGVSPTSGGDDADVYDPDQPLWNTDHPNTSTDLLMLPSSKVGDKALWDADASSSARHSPRLSDGIGSDILGRSGTRRRVDSRFRSENGSRNICALPLSENHGNERKEVHKELITNSNASNLYNRYSAVEIGSKVNAIQSGSRSYSDSEHRSHRLSTKATRTLRVYGIPQAENKWNALISHFKKFGKVIHIYIPPNSEKAFVQFTKWEEAEAALKSPDAVMGNRFIKLSWANHDRIPVEVQSGAHTRTGEPPSAVMASVSSQQLVEARKKTFPSCQQGSHAANVSTDERAISVSGHQKLLLTNIPVAAPLVPKKVENTELLEEIRRKQELLDKKRDEFKRQLDKIEKQAISVKKEEAMSERVVKRQKVDVDSEATKATNCRNLYSSQKCQGVEKSLEKRKSDEVLVSPTLKANLATLQPSQKNMNNRICMTPPLLNRFKLDNRSTSFRILPPLPADFANVAVLKEHFSRFGVVSSVVLEQLEAHTENAGSKSSDNCSACISFANRHSAERAYQSGKCWEGHSLQFKWMTVTPNSSSMFGTQEASTVKINQNSDIPAAPASAPVGAVNTGCDVISEIAAVGNEEHSADVEGTNFALTCPLECSLPTSQTGSTMALDEKKCPGESDASSVEGGINATS